MENTVTIPITLPAPVFWGAITLLGIIVASFLVFWSLPDVKKADGPLTDLKKRLGMERVHTVPFLVGAALWAGIALALVVGLFGLIIDILGAVVPDRDNTPNVWEFRFKLVQLTALTTVLAAVVALPLTAIRLRLARQQTQTAQEGLITERISKAVEGLGSEKIIKRQRISGSGKKVYLSGEDGEPDFSQPVMEEVSEPNLEVRIGAIYALERISQDSPRDHIQIMEVLCAYIRHNSQALSLDPTKNLKTRAIPRIDIQTIITVIGRRQKERKNHEAEHQYKLDLSRTDVSGADFSNADFDSAIFASCRLEGAFFTKTSLRGAYFGRSLLNHADWFRADLTGASFVQAVLNAPTPTVGGMNETFNMAESLKGARFDGADLSAVDYLGEPEILNETFGTSDTILTDELDQNRDGLKEKQRALSIALRRGEMADAADAEKSLRESGFMNWSPHPRTDSATGWRHSRLAKKLNLKGFPFI